MPLRALCIYRQIQRGKRLQSKLSQSLGHISTDLRTQREWESGLPISHYSTAGSWKTATCKTIAKEKKTQEKEKRKRRNKLLWFSAKYPHKTRGKSQFLYGCPIRIILTVTLILPASIEKYIRSCKADKGWNFHFFPSVFSSLLKPSNQQMVSKFLGQRKLH